MDDVIYGFAATYETVSALVLHQACGFDEELHTESGDLFRIEGVTGGADLTTVDNPRLVVTLEDGVDAQQMLTRIASRYPRLRFEFEGHDSSDLPQLPSQGRVAVEWAEVVEGDVDPVTRYKWDVVTEPPPTEDQLRRVAEVTLDDLAGTIYHGPPSDRDHVISQRISTGEPADASDDLALPLRRFSEGWVEGSGSTRLEWMYERLDRFQITVTVTEQEPTVPANSTPHEIPTELGIEYRSGLLGRVARTDYFIPDPKIDADEWRRCIRGLIETCEQADGANG